MQLNKIQKIFLLIFTLLPSFAIIVIPGIQYQQNNFDAYTWVDLIWSVISLGVLIFYLVHVTRNPYMSGKSKTWWGVLMILISTLTMIFYWFKHIWPDYEIDTETEK